MNEPKRNTLNQVTGSQWRGVETLPTEDGWYLGNFNGAMRCIGFDNGKFDFWGTPSDQRPEDLTHWTELPPIDNAKMDNGERNADKVKSTLVERLREGAIQTPRRWSGDCGEMSTVDEIATDELMVKAADEIEQLEAKYYEGCKFERENQRLLEREKMCETMDKAEKLALIRALQEIRDAVGLLGDGVSPREIVAAVISLSMNSH